MSFEAIGSGLGRMLSNCLSGCRAACSPPTPKKTRFSKWRGPEESKKWETDLGMAHSYLNKCESGERTIDVAELWAICKIYKKPMSYFAPDEL